MAEQQRQNNTSGGFSFDKAPERIGVPESVSPRDINLHFQQHDDDDEIISEELDGSAQGSAPNSALPEDLYDLGDGQVKLKNSEVYQQQQAKRLSKKSEQRKQSYKLDNGKFQIGGARSLRSQSDVRSQNTQNYQTNQHNPQMLIEVKSEKSELTDQYKESQVDMQQRTNSSIKNKQMMSPANAQSNNSPNPDVKISAEPLYKVWTGDQIFFFDGKIQIGINIWQPILTFVLINFLGTFLLGNTIRDLTLKREGFMPVLYIGIALQVSASILLISAASKDPASIPSRVFLYKAYKRRTDMMSEELRTKYMDIVNGRLTKIKYCSACDIYRPPRTIHCGTCGCCIERLDHHCPWIGTCVGKRNYKYFISFLWSVFLLVLFSIIFCSVHIALDLAPGDSSFTINQILSIVILTLVSSLGIFVFFLFGYHQYLLCRNETTNENLKHSYAKLGNPFQRGIFDNCRRLFARDKRNWKPEEYIVRSTDNPQGRDRIASTGSRQLNRLSVNSIVTSNSRPSQTKQSKEYEQLEHSSSRTPTKPDNIELPDTAGKVSEMGIINTEVIEQYDK